MALKLLTIVLAVTFLFPLASTVSQTITGARPQAVEDTYIPEPAGYAVSTWVQGLDTPWSLVFLPDERALVSERPGRIRLIEADGRLRAAPYAEPPDIAASGEGGLMGLALHPDFPREPYVYAMATRRMGGAVVNTVFRLRHAGDRAAFDREIIGGIPAAQLHNGGRIAFGPDGMLYVATGDAMKPELAADLHSLAGKILRLTPEGAVPPDNPFPNSPVYSYGHRNVQGLAWHPRTRDLFASEHGPTGEFGLQARDEINVIRPAGNYGWPTATCAVHRAEFVDPLVCWPETAVPPSGMAFYKGDLFLATLRSQALIRIGVETSVEGYRVTAIERWFVVAPSEGFFGRLRETAAKVERRLAATPSGGGLGRLRDVVVGPDGTLYVLTNNRSRGRALEGDDRVLKLTPR